MKKNYNYYYLICALLMLVSVIAHPSFGQFELFPSLKAGNITPFVQQNLIMGWNLASSTSLFCTIALIIMAFYHNKDAVKPVILLIFGINLGRYLMVILVGLTIGNEIFRDLLAQSVYMFILLGILILGLRKDSNYLSSNKYS